MQTVNKVHVAAEIFIKHQDRYLSVNLNNEEG